MNDDRRFVREEGISSHSEELARVVGGEIADAVEGGAAACEVGFGLAFLEAVDGMGVCGEARGV